MLAASAGFFILPGAGRLWVPSREIVKAEVQSIWQTHRITYLYDDYPVMEWPFRPAKLGEITKVGNGLFYGTSDGWARLIPLRRPIPWKAGEHKNWDPYTFV